MRGAIWGELYGGSYLEGLKENLHRFSGHRGTFHGRNFIARLSEKFPYLSFCCVAIIQCTCTLFS